MKRLIKFVLLIVIVVWVYGLFYYKQTTSQSYVEDPCKRTSSVNPCIVISTDKLYEIQ